MATLKPLTFEAEGKPPLDVDVYNQATFRAMAGIGEFERPFAPAVADLRNLLDGASTVTLTMYEDAGRTTPAVTATGSIRYYISQNVELGQIVERVTIEGDVVFP